MNYSEIEHHVCMYMAEGDAPFKTKECTVDSYFRERNLTVPKFQREYEWTVKEEITQLWDDLEDNLESDDDAYFLATPIIYPMKDGTGEMGIVDGQQRTITLSLFVAACRDSLLKIGTIPAGIASASISEVIYRRKTKSTKLTTRQEKDRDELEGVLNNDLFSYSDEYGSSANDHRIAKCYRYFYDKINERLIGKTDEEKIDIIETRARQILDKTYFGLTTADDASVAILIFMTMNNRGKNLEQSDLVKAELFDRANKVNNATGKEAIKRWGQLKGDHTSKYLSNLLHDYITMRFGSTPSGGSYRSYSKLFKPWKLKSDYVKFLKEINKFDGVYNRYGDPQGKLEYTDLVRCKVRYATSLLAQAEISGATASQLSEIEKIVDTIYAHHFVAEKDSNILKRKIIGWSNHVYKNEDIESLIDTMKKDVVDSKLLLTRESFVHSMKLEKRFSNMNEAQFFLRRIERLFLPSGTTILGPSAVNIEHIAPKNPKTGEWVHITEEKKHSIGNLTLCDSDKNKKLGNKTWDKKSKTWRDSATPYATTANHLKTTDANGNEIDGPSLDLSLPDWTDATIDERAGRIAGFCYDMLFNIE